MIPKDNHYRDGNLLALARGQRCLFRIPGICRDDSETVVAAHSNEGQHGKGKAIKAHDFMSAWACHWCHTAYDSEAHDAELKLTWFAEAHERQVEEWGDIAANICLRPRNRDAARDALLAYVEWLKLE